MFLRSIFKSAHLRQICICKERLCPPRRRSVYPWISFHWRIVQQPSWSIFRNLSKDHCYWLWREIQISLPFIFVHKLSKIGLFDFFFEFPHSFSRIYKMSEIESNHQFLSDFVMNSILMKFVMPSIDQSLKRVTYDNHGPGLFVNFCFLISISVWKLTVRAH